MGTPNIVAMRIDERLIHGQGQLWVRALGVNTVIVANDSASEDKMQQALMKTVIPKTIAVRFFSVQHTCDIIMKASPKQTIFIICQTAADALKLIIGGVPVKEINVGNIHNADGKQEVTRSIFLGPDDKAALRALRDTHHILFNTKTMPTGGDGTRQVDLNNYLD